jgi:2-keto-3-deoxy-L-fuconate dehydrogenase
LTAQDGRLAGIRALVTGGASGIGAAVAQRFAEEGASVVAADIAGADLEVDVRDGESVCVAVAEAVARLGGLDVVVCNAGVSVRGEAHELDDTAWNEALATNLSGVFFGARAAWPHLVASGRGSVLVTASAAGLWPEVDAAAYCVAKAGAIMLTRCLALTGAPVGVRANCVCPGSVETPMLDRFLATQPDPQATRAHMESLHPLGRLGRPAEVADAFVYLASEEAAWTTGAVLVVDGGRTAGSSLLLSTHGHSA